MDVRYLTSIRKKQNQKSVKIGQKVKGISEIPQNQLKFFKFVKFGKSKHPPFNFAKFSQISSNFVVSFIRVNGYF